MPWPAVSASHAQPYRDGGGGNEPRGTEDDGGEGFHWLDVQVEMITGVITLKTASAPGFSSKTVTSSRDDHQRYQPARTGRAVTSYGGP